jgi:hypothetical protein
MTTDLFTYVPLVRGAAVPEQEVESAQTTVEVRILWGATVLHVAHLGPQEAFYVGEPTANESDCNYVIAARALGARRLPIVMPLDGGARLLVPTTADGHLDARGGERQSLDDLKGCGLAGLSHQWPGAHELDLAAGDIAHLKLRATALVFQVSVVNAGRRVPAGALMVLEPADFAYTTSSLALHVGILALLAFFCPKLGWDDDASVDRDNVVAMTKLLNAAAAREETVPDAPDAPASSTFPASVPEDAALGGGRAMGGQRAAAGGPHAMDGSSHAVDSRLERTVSLRDASRFGAVELLEMLADAEHRDPNTSWGRAAITGSDDVNAVDRMFGRGIDEAVGSGVFDPGGPGEDGEHGADLVGLRDIGGLDPGPGGSPQGVGVGRALSQRVHPVSAPRVRDELTTVNGHLRPEVIQRVVRQNFGRFRFCYEAGLRGDPGLQGRVVVKFVIDRAGAVALSTDAGGDLPDARVTQCVVRAFGDLSFPAPDGGMVTVVYPIVFNAM